MQSVPLCPLLNLTYVSTRAIPPDRRVVETGEMVARARSRNGINHISGALLFTDIYFVQTLEGLATTVDDLMSLIEKDHRHTAVSVIDRSTVSAPAFTCWSMAYSGPSLFVSRAVSRVLPGLPSRPQGISRLLRLIRELGAA